MLVETRAPGRDDAVARLKHNLVAPRAAAAHKPEMAAADLA
jgi:hypothetical protein